MKGQLLLCSVGVDSFCQSVQLIWYMYWLFKTWLLIFCLSKIIFLPTYLLSQINQWKWTTIKAMNMFLFFFFVFCFFPLFFNYIEKIIILYFSFLTHFGRAMKNIGSLEKCEDRKCLYVLPCVFSREEITSKPLLLTVKDQKK